MHIRQAVDHLVRAAACEEKLEDGSHSEVLLYFVARSVATECGIDITDTINRSRSYAATQARED
jgi:hypothetical protein